MSFELSEELKLLRDMVRDFVAKELLPLEEQVEEADDVPPDVLRRLRTRARDLGLLGLNIPAECGGAGLGMLANCILREELGRTSLAMSYTIRGPSPVLSLGTPAQREKYLAPCLRAEKRDSFALTEPNAGSDAAAISTTAARDGDHFILNGTKIFVTDGQKADFAIVFAVTDKEKRAQGGITAFLVDKGTPGFRVGALFKKMGWRGTDLAELVFTDCRVPAESVLGEVGQGFAIAMKWIDQGRLGVAAAAVGTAERLLEMASQYARQRVTFGKPLADRQAIQWMIADSATEIAAARLLVYQAAGEGDRGRNVRSQAAMAKLYASEMVGRVADRTLQIHGGMGYMKELPIERMYRDVRYTRIAEGTSEILRHLIARGILKG
ncbi:MAG: acyl-CoA dehydrogenase family protein [Candidatus Tectomicrobia bacterium]|nr:acyl-CoA dehydrogenase family protein [Candidatus Tectomicrobia bacterium]